jgi:hypothetical protein
MYFMDFIVFIAGREHCGWWEKRSLRECTRHAAQNTGGALSLHRRRCGEIGTKIFS